MLGGLGVVSFLVGLLNLSITDLATEPSEARSPPGAGAAGRGSLLPLAALGRTASLCVQIPLFLGHQSLASGPILGAQDLI